LLYFVVAETLRILRELFGSKLRWFEFSLLRASEKEGSVGSKVNLLNESERQTSERVRVKILCASECVKEKSVNVTWLTDETR
jgi:hypothetical protein